jgi:phage baseplate assembly protein W
MNIKITSLKAGDIVEKSLKNDYLYKDIAFDLEPTVSYNNQLNKKEYLKDVQALYDIEAIKTSISNAFLTSPRQKILNPEFGVDLRRYLFEPVDVFTADLIQDDIELKLPEAEPRIKVENVTVFGDEDNQEYHITLQINVPSLNVRGVSIKSKLNSNGYTIL